MPPGKRTDQDVVTEIWRLAALGLSPAQIEDALCDDERFEDRVPDRRTIQRWAREVIKRGGGPRWRLSEPEEDQRPVAEKYVLDSLAAVIHVTEGRVSQLSEGEARWIAHLRSLVPGLRAFEAYLLAQDYGTLVAREADTGGLDAYVAFRRYFETFADFPWRDEYRRALENRWIRPGPSWWEMDEPTLWGREFSTNRTEDKTGSGDDPPSGRDESEPPH